MKKFISVIITVVLCVCCFVPADAEVIDSVDIDVMNSRVTVAGKLGSEDNNRLLGIKIVNKATGGIYAIFQAELPYSGEYSHTLGFDAPTGEYEITLTAANESHNETASKSFIFSNAWKDALDVFDDPQKVKSAEDVNAFMTNNRVALFIESDHEYFSLTDTSLADKTLFENRPYAGDYNRFISTLADTSVASCVTEAKDAEELISLLDKYKSLIKVDLGTGVYKNGMSDEAQNAVLTKMLAEEFEACGEVNDFFTKTVLFTAFSPEVGIRLGIGAYDFLYAYKDIIPIDFTQYNKIDEGSRYKVNDKFVGKVFSSYEEVKAFFDEACQGVLKEQTESTTGKKTGNGGSGGGAGKIYSVVPAEEESAAPGKAEGDGFSDVSKEHWAYGAVNYFVQKKVIAGDGTGNFRPEESITREEFAKLLVTAFEMEVQKDGCNFSDADTGAWYYPYICTAAQNGVVMGMPDGSFGVGMKITRQDMAIMLRRACEKKGIALDKKNEALFSDDAAISDYAKEAVYALGGAGILSGMPDGSFSAQGSTGRAQAVMALYKTMTRGV